MQLTLETLFSEPRIINAVIDRTMQASQDIVHWRRYLTPHESMSTTFATYLGTTSQVIAGTMIDPHSKKPLRQRRGIRKGAGTIGTFGDAFQIDNARLDMLLELIKKYNASQDAAVINEIVDFLMDDWRDVLLAPMFAIDKMVGDARSRGLYQVNLNGGDYEEIKLPVSKVVASSADLGSFVTWYRDLLEDFADKGMTFSVAQITAKTFHNKIVKSKEFVNTFIHRLGAIDINPASVVTVAMANELIKAAGIETPFEIVNERVTLAGGKAYKSFADNAMCLLPQDNLGTLEFYKSDEWSDPVPNRTYTQAESGAVLISSYRTEEGRFLEYQMNAAPNLRLPHKMAIVDLSANPA